MTGIRRWIGRMRSFARVVMIASAARYTALLPSEAFPKAKANARKALELNERLAEAHVSLAYSALVYDWSYPEAEKEFKRAIDLRPGYATAHQYYAYYLTAMGDLSQAIAERKLAVSIEPRSRLLNSALGEAYYHARQRSETPLTNYSGRRFEHHKSTKSAGVCARAGRC